jgi:hypothetical protein
MPALGFASRLVLQQTVAMGEPWMAKSDMRAGHCSGMADRPVLKLLWPSLADGSMRRRPLVRSTLGGSRLTLALCPCRGHQLAGARQNFRFRLIARSPSGAVFSTI